MIPKWICQRLIPLALFSWGILFDGLAIGQVGRKEATFSQPSTFRAIPTFACARLDVRGDVEISTFLFEDPVAETGALGKVFRLVQRYSVERLKVTSATRIPLSHAEVRQRLQSPSTVLLRNGDIEILPDWLELFSPETLVITAPPAAADLEEVSDSIKVPSPRYGQVPPQFVYALSANANSVKIRSVRSETSIETKKATVPKSESPATSPDTAGVTVVDILDETEFKYASLARIRRSKSGNSVRAFLPGDVRFPTPSLLFQTDDAIGISDFYLSIVNPDSLSVVSGFKSLPKVSVVEHPKPSVQSKEEKAAALTRAGNRLPTIKALMQRREYPAALQELDEVIQIDPDNPLPHYLQSFLFHQSGRMTEAKAAVSSGADCEVKRPIRNWYKQLEWLQGPSRSWLEERRSERHSK